MPIPGKIAPKLEFDTVAHGAYALHADAPPGGSLVVFYRGLHCPICKKQLKELDDRIGDFAIRGVRVVAVSGDTPERAKQIMDEMQIIRLPVGHSLDLRSARNDWGLFLSNAREGTEEPDIFSEPGHFWVRQDGSLSFSVIHSLPFMRPDVDGILKAIDFTLSKGFPPRGSFEGDL